MSNKKNSLRNKKAIVLLSGGLDSTVTLFLAKKKGYKIHCLIFDYGQRHKNEIKKARLIAKRAKCPYWLIKFNLPKKSSSLLKRDAKMKLSAYCNNNSGKNNIPTTYVPARNIIFLSFALSYAESFNIKNIFIGAHSQDYSGYPDCRPEFYRAFSKVASSGTRSGVMKETIRIETPLLYSNKSQIIKMGFKVKAPMELTWSCYKGGRRPCAECDSCYFRAKGFKDAGFLDPAFEK